jgi:phospholipid/cholesterol/gamma-HCH transport system ATP-binding protein
MIEVKNVFKSFENEFVLNDVSVHFEVGKCNMIIGRSGSGKTVLLKSIVGLLEIDKGEIWYDDRLFSQMELKERQAIRKEMGMLFQGAALFDSLTVEQNVLFPLNMFSTLSTKEKLKQVDFCLERVRINNANKLFPAELSGGMKKRVAIARAIALNPKYLFCDEPNSGLDPETGIVIDKLIKEITEEFNITTIINSHDMNSVLEIGEKVIYIYKGCKCWEGTKEEIMNTDNEALNNFVFATTLAQQIKK